MDGSRALRRGKTFALLILIVLEVATILQGSQAQTQDKDLILFDASHGVWSDPYHGKFTIDDGYSILAKALRDEAFQVGEIAKASISSEVLSNAKALVITSLKIGLTTDEMSAVEGFVARGGGLLVLGDSNVVLDSDGYARLNALTARFDIRFDQDTIWDLDDSVPGSAKIFIHEFLDHEITVATGSIIYVWGSSLAVGSKAEAIAFADKDSWADKNLNRKIDQGEKGGPLPVVAVSEYGDGRVVVAGERRFLTSLQIGDPKAARMASSGMGFDTLSFALKTFYWLTRAHRETVVVRQGKVVALIPTSVYQQEKERLGLAFETLNVADAYFSQLYNKTFASIPFEVFPIFSRPNDPQMWGATISRNKIMWAAWYLDKKNVNDEDYVWSVLHEYTHSFNSYHYPYMLPSWLDEGLASAVPLTILPEIGLSNYADAEWQSLKEGAATYIAKQYTSALLWNHSSFDERSAAYGFACSIAKHVIDTYGWGTITSFFRLLELQSYPLGEPTNLETYDVDPVIRTNRAIQRLCILTHDAALLEKFLEWRFPVSNETQQSVLRSLSEPPGLKLIKRVQSGDVKTGQSVEIRIEALNVSGRELNPIEVIDSVSLGFVVSEGITTWRSTLKSGQNINLTYAIQPERVGTYVLPNAIGLYNIGREAFSVARSDSAELKVSLGPTTLTATTTITYASHTATTTTALPTSLQTGAASVYQITITSAQLIGGVSTIEMLGIAGVAFAIILAAGVSYLRRRRK